MNYFYTKNILYYGYYLCNVIHEENNKPIDNLRYVLLFFQQLS